MKKQKYLINCQAINQGGEKIYEKNYVYTSLLYANDYLLAGTKTITHLHKINKKTYQKVVQPFGVGWRYIYTFTAVEVKR